jgi:hypothetical protein
VFVGDQLAARVENDLPLARGRSSGNAQDLALTLDVHMCSYKGEYAAHPSPKSGEPF